MSPFEQFVQGRLQDLQKPQYYIKRWLHIYGQWEFWALAAVVIGAYYGADAAGWLPRYFVDHPRVTQGLVTALIMLPLPVLIKYKEKRLHGRPDWWQRLGRSLTASGYVVPIISFNLVIAAVAFLGPAFINPTTKLPFTGYELLLQQPVAAVIPLLFIVSAIAVLTNYDGWRWTACLWTLGAFFGVWAVVIGYTDVDTDITGYRQIFTGTLVIAPVLALTGFLVMSEEAAATASRHRLKPFWPFSYLGDDWTEAIMNLGLLLLLSPALIIIWCLTLAWAWVALVFRFPEPECVPAVVLDDEQPAQAIFDLYTEAFHEVAGKMSATFKAASDSLVVRTKNAKVELWQMDDMVGLTIDGLDTGYWHTGEDGNIDEYFWIAIGALRHGIKHKRNLLYMREGWVYCDEMSIWAVVSAAEGGFSYMKYRRDRKKS